MKKRRSRFSTTKRANDGYIITARNMTDGTERVFHRGGYNYRNNNHTHRFTARDVLSSMCDEIESWGDSWRIICISSPETIYTDLQSRQRNPVPGYDNEAIALPPEVPMLILIGKEHLWWNQSQYRSSIARARRRTKSSDRVITLP